MRIDLTCEANWANWLLVYFLSELPKTCISIWNQKIKRSTISIFINDYNVNWNNDFKKTDKQKKKFWKFSIKLPYYLLVV